MRAEILTIGDELCRGEIVDTNSSYLAARLWDLDITTRWMTSCTDDADDIAAAVTQAVARADLVVCSGGLGPTEDDLTVEVLARLTGAEVVIDEPAKVRMMERFGRLLSSQAPMGNIEELTRIQLRQVRVPAGARVHGNPVGLAPCFEVPVAGVPVVCLPGVPRELHGIFDAALAARFTELREARGEVERIARRIYRAFGRGESQVSQACRGLVDGVPGASIHYQVKFPETLVKLVVRDRDQAAADARLEALDAGVRERLAGVVYGTGEQETLVERVMRRLIEGGARLATAESCTGGMLGELVTRMPGSSKAYAGGVIVYSNDEKVRLLGVAPRTLQMYGTVSEPTVREMASGALGRIGSDPSVAGAADTRTPDASAGMWPDGSSAGRRMQDTGRSSSLSGSSSASDAPDTRHGVDFAVAITGIAGPDGGTPDKPVGTVWIALAGFADGEPTILATKKLSWPGARDQVRLLASWWGLKLIDEALDRKQATR